MENWIELSALEYDEVWDRIVDDFNFEPSVSNFPSFEVPNPFITYDVSSYFNWSGDSVTYDEIYSDLEEKSLLVFQELTQKNEYMYAVDWQHPGYWINPRLEFPKTSLMNGSYLFFQTVITTFLFTKILNGDY